MHDCSGDPQDPAQTGGRLTKETIILEPTSPTTHFVFKPAARDALELKEGAAARTESAAGGEEAVFGAGGKGGDADEMRLDRFKHVPGCLVCRGNLGHVKVGSYCSVTDGAVKASVAVRATTIARRTPPGGDNTHHNLFSFRADQDGRFCARALFT